MVSIKKVFLTIIKIRIIEMVVALKRLLKYSLYLLSFVGNNETTSWWQRKLDLPWVRNQTVLGSADDTSLRVVKIV